ncbi:hypothetical protein [Bradyrhizobium sp. 183]|uniref:hypothetical protein n=1 Tax=unclassified Bradyrhizobium TaxID=2631580 RepID=UPI003207BB81
MQKGWRLDGLGQRLFEIFLPGLEFLHLLHYAFRRIDVVGRQDQFHQFVEFTLYPRKLVPHRSQTGSTLDPQPVDLAGKLATEFLK